MAGLEAAYGDVDLRLDFLALSILACITKNIMRGCLDVVVFFFCFFILYSHLLNYVVIMINEL